ncbi:MAG: L-fucose mutarotase [Sediminibacterium sp.]
MLHRHCLALDLVEDEILIAGYEKWHKEVWPEIIESIKSSGVEQMEIYRVGNRLFMIMEVNNDFSFDAKSKADSNNPKVQEWEQMLWKFQQPLPFAKPGEKWILMQKIFQLS